MNLFSKAKMERSVNQQDNALLDKEDSQPVVTSSVKVLTLDHQPSSPSSNISVASSEVSFNEYKPLREHATFRLRKSTSNVRISMGFEITRIA